MLNAFKSRDPPPLSLCVELCSICNKFNNKITYWKTMNDLYILRLKLQLKTQGYCDLVYKTPDNKYVSVMYHGMLECHVRYTSWIDEWAHKNWMNNKLKTRYVSFIQLLHRIISILVCLAISPHTIYLVRVWIASSQCVNHLSIKTLFDMLKICCSLKGKVVWWCLVLFTMVHTSRQHSYLQCHLSTLLLEMEIHYCDFYVISNDFRFS